MQQWSKFLLAETENKYYTRGIDVFINTERHRRGDMRKYICNMLDFVRNLSSIAVLNSAKCLMGAVAFSLISGCGEKENKEDVIRFAVCADYPPFEYYENGKIVGFDIELAKSVAEKLGKKAVFEDMSLMSVLASVQNELVDAAVSALASTKEREKNCDFSSEYYLEKFSVVYRHDKPITTQSQLAGAKIACQLGSTMEIWLKKNVPAASVIATDNNNQAIESLKADHADCVLMDEIQAAAFCKKNSALSCSQIATSGNGYAIAVKKGSPLRDKINNALKKLISDGEIKKLETKWLAE
jgi:polar amino acid transport system substrate-binding protein